MPYYQCDEPGGVFGLLLVFLLKGWGDSKNSLSLD